jgi:K+-transporting ATPase ATPase C chain
VTARAARFGAPIADVPPDLLEASGSGLDPHISPEAACFQVDRIIRARNLDQLTKTSLFGLIGNNIENPTMGMLGESRVNVLKLNLALDSLAGVLK